MPSQNTMGSLLVSAIPNHPIGETMHPEEEDAENNLLLGMSGDDDLLDGDRSLFKTNNSGTNNRLNGPNHQIGTFLASRNPLETQTNQATVGGVQGLGVGRNIGNALTAPEEIRAEIELE